MQLKEALDLYGKAANQRGFSPNPIAERLANGTTKVTVYHEE